MRNDTKTPRALSAVFYSISLCLLLSACSRTVTLEEEISASQASLRWLGEKYGTSSSPEAVDYLKQITSRINHAAPIVGLSYTPLQSLNWNVVVINAPDQNAFSLGAGTIVITRTLALSLTTEAELAAVLAHEMSHQYLGHTRRALAKAKRSPNAPDFSYAQSEELDADTLAVKLLTAARFDPRHAQHAIEIAYRPAERVVASSEWLRERELNIKREIDSVGYFFPATETSREFERFRRSLVGR